MGCNSSSAKSPDFSLDFYALKNIDGEVASESTVKFAGNERSHNVVSWIPSNKNSIRAIVLISHGLHEHALRYQGVAHALTNRGYAVFAIDHIGHGLSDGTKALISDHEDLKNDFVKFFRHVHGIAKTFPNMSKRIPFLILGHSMGTLVTIVSINPIVQAMEELNRDSDTKAYLIGVTLSGAALVPGPAAASPFGVSALYPITKTKAAESLASVLSSVDPMGPTAPILLDGISSDAKEREILFYDPRRYPGDIRNKTAFELLKMINKVRSEVPLIQVPVLCLHGADDPIALPAGSEFIHSNLGNQKDCRLQILPGLRHEILHEGPVATAQVTGLLVGFFDRRLDVFSM